MVVASVALLVGRTGDVRACSCASNAFDLPATGTTGVPTNLRSIYFSAYSANNDVRLRAADGEEIDVGVVPTAPGYGNSLWVASVPTELRPNTYYTLWHEPPGSNEILLSFTTGSGPDHVAPPSPRFERLRIEYVGGDEGPCGRATARIDGYVAAPRDVDIATVVVRFVRSNGESEERILPPSPTGTLNSQETVWFPGILGSGTCQVNLEFVEGERYLVETWTVDFAGNPSDVTSQQVDLGGGCRAGQPGSLGGGLAVLALALRRRRPRASGGRSLARSGRCLPWEPYQGRQLTIGAKQ